MEFTKSSISLPQSFIPGSCQAERLHIVLSRPVTRITTTREEFELKQLAYERKRAAWRKKIGLVPE